MQDEVPLPGGNVSGEVMRVGDTVRKPWTASSDSVDHLLGYLKTCHFHSAPTPFGRDSKGRQTLEYIPGEVAQDLPVLDVEGLSRVGGLIRELHDLTAVYEPPLPARWNVILAPDREELVCHNDLGPWNLVIGGDRWALIDWDTAGPSSREWELAYAAHGFVGMAEGNDPREDAVRLSALVDGYRLSRSSRERLCHVLSGPTRAMWRLLVAGRETGAEPWAQLHAEGHADHWGPAADYIERHAGLWRTALA